VNKIRIVIGQYVSADGTPATSTEWLVI